MPFISSPVAYPATSSPRQENEYNTKRRKLSDPAASAAGPTRWPLQSVEPNIRQRPQDANRQERHIGGFVLDGEDSDEEDDVAAFRDIYSGGDVLSSEDKEGSKQASLNLVQDNAAVTQLDCLPTITGSIGPSKPSTSISCFSTTSSGKRVWIPRRSKTTTQTYEELIASRSLVPVGRAQKSYYGINIHQLIEDINLAEKEKAESQQTREEDTMTSLEMDSFPEPEEGPKKKKHRHMIWTEKYRARKFTDLVGDERTHRSVLRWLKAWDPIVFPGAAQTKPKLRPGPEQTDTERAHRKILLLTGPPGLGKTTLAHVCARQAGYEVQEINASDERSRDVVKNRIRDMVGTENVRSVETSLDPAARTGSSKVSRPVCVIVDEVDGVVSGSSGGASAGEGGFIKALVDLLYTDQKNSNKIGNNSNDSSATGSRKQKGDRFRMLRPVILICNDVYHPSLRFLRQGTLAEVIHVRKAPISMVVSRMQAIFEKEGISSDIDGIRSLCEASWGVSNNRKESDRTNGTGEGDIRGILVVGEWTARKFRAELTKSQTSRHSHSSDVAVRLSKAWIQRNILGDLAHGGGAARGLGRGGSKEVVDRVFAFNAGFPVQTATGPGVSRSSGSGKQFKVPGSSGSEHVKSELQSSQSGDSQGKQIAIERLREMIESGGEDDRIMTDCFTSYPGLPFQDDNYLTKPCQAYDWLHFQDTLSSLVHQSQEWELAAYLSSPILAFHQLFSSRSPHSYTAAMAAAEDAAATTTADGQAAPEPSPFSGARAAYTASELTKANSSALQGLHTTLSLPLQRSFRSSTALSTDLVPYLLRMLHPDVKPVLVNTASEKGGNVSTASVRRGAEKELVSRSVQAMVACGVSFERGRLEFDSEDASNPALQGQAMKGWIYRMNPPIDSLSHFSTCTSAPSSSAGPHKVRYGVRQVLQQEYERELIRRDREARLARVQAKNPSATGTSPDLSQTANGATSWIVGPAAADSRTVGQSSPVSKIVAEAPVKRDFFGNPILASTSSQQIHGFPGAGGLEAKRRRTDSGYQAVDGGEGGRAAMRKVWITYNEGFSNAVRKGITLPELLHGL